MADEEAHHRQGTDPRSRALLKETELSEIEIEQDDFRIRVSRAGPPARRRSLCGAAAARRQPRRPSRRAAGSLADPARHPGCVPSPMVGTVYRSPEPGAQPFVEVGDDVAAGQTILIVEAMKHMNEVAAPRAGKVRRDPGGGRPAGRIWRSR